MCEFLGNNPPKTDTKIIPWKQPPKNRYKDNSLETTPQKQIQR